MVVLTGGPVRVHPVGWGAALVEVESTEAVRAVHQRLLDLRASGRLPTVTDLVPAARTVLVEAQPHRVPDLAALLAGSELAGGGADPAATEPVEVPVRYDGPDLAEVAELSGLTPAEVVRRHAAAELTVAFCGFAPGFAYLIGLPAELRVPRRPTPRTAVEPGSVGLAGEFTGVYPRRVPGGWRIVGRTDATVWDPERDPPALLGPGTPVRFRPV